MLQIDLTFIIFRCCFSILTFFWRQSSINKLKVFFTTEGCTVFCVYSNCIKNWSARFWGDPTLYVTNMPFNKPLLYYELLSPSMTSQFIKHCWDVYEQNSILNSVRVIGQPNDQSLLVMNGNNKWIFIPGSCRCARIGSRWWPWYSGVKQNRQWRKYRQLQCTELDVVQTTVLL